MSLSLDKTYFYVQLPHSSRSTQAVWEAGLRLCVGLNSLTLSEWHWLSHSSSEEIKTSRHLMSLNPCLSTLQGKLSVITLHLCADSVVWLQWTISITLWSHRSASLYFSCGASLIKLPAVRWNLFCFSVSRLSREKIDIFWDECNETPVQVPSNSQAR